MCSAMPSADDVDSIGECASLLHPDHAWTAGSRRGSSQSETLEVEVYQLGKDFSRSLPGSRRSSFQQQDKGNLISYDVVISVARAVRDEHGRRCCGAEGAVEPPRRSERRRSSCVRRDPDDILRSLRAVKGELGRTLSLSGSTARLANYAAVWSQTGCVVPAGQGGDAESAICNGLEIRRATAENANRFIYVATRQYRAHSALGPLVAPAPLPLFSSGLSMTP
ncbi:hypothetical protein EVAR_80501_1 [Eumeta japonica]|uniref:Uncharacterized protein n=1 Tax=Eumeta variegata TaxID=151549 RepID=A0A4C1TL62_EUMVA|nr:hypothetical protein EVAR_80501_1 [Eumeta japonica]